MKTGIISFFGGSHGKTQAALSSFGVWSEAKQGFGSFVPGISTAPYPYCYRAS